RRRHTIFDCDWSSDVCSSDLAFVVRNERTFQSPQTVTTAQSTDVFAHAHGHVRRAARFEYRPAPVRDSPARTFELRPGTATFPEIGRASRRERVTDQTCASTC